MEKTVQIAMLLDLYGGLLTEKQTEYLELYYGEDYSLTEIAELHGITPQGVKDTIHRATGSLFDTEEKLGFLKKRMEVHAVMDAMELLLKDLDGPKSQEALKQLSQLQEMI